uniref:Exoribonuclease phosphorolytic domain-containing protein n=1 Tax=Xenopus tropicalis TaxID=8364 RepID=A0A6I8QYW8_XENTR
MVIQITERSLIRKTPGPDRKKITGRIPKSVPFSANGGTSRRCQVSYYNHWGDHRGMGGERAETRGHLLCDLRWAPFSRRGPWSGSCPAGPSPRQAGLQLQESLEPAVRLDRYPRAEMIVWVLVLEDRGSALPAAVSCASLPLADTGIETFNLALGCGLSRGPGGELLLDPDDDEEEAGSGGTMSLSLLPTLNQVSAWAFSIIMYLGLYSGRLILEYIRYTI